MISKSTFLLLFIFIRVNVAQDIDQPPFKDLPPIIIEVWKEDEEPVEVFIDGLRLVGEVARKISAIAASVEVIIMVITRNFVELSSTPLFIQDQIFNLVQLALYFLIPI